MSLSRRNFVKAAGVGGIGVLTAPLIAARGSEALRDSFFTPTTLWNSDGIRFESDERAPYRVASPDAVRLDSNENPNGPGANALDAVRAMFGEAPRYPDVQTTDLQAAIANELFELKHKQTSPTFTSEK